MTPRQIELVRTTLCALAARPAEVAGLFYARLFELDPTLRALFGTDMDAQGRKLMTALATVADGLTRPDRIVPVLRRIARRHVACGVRARHYATVGAALLETLEAGLGAAFTPEVRAAWTAAYGRVADTMMAAARSASAARAAA